VSGVDPVAVTLRVTGILERLDVPYVVGGSMATMVHGEARSTRDVDIVARLEHTHVEPLASALGTEFYCDRESIHEAVRSHRHFNLIHLPTMFKVDVFVPPAGGLDDAKWSRKQRVELRREELAWVTDPECIVLQKLARYRAGSGASDQQWRDVLGVLKTQAEGLDWSFLSSWASRLDVGELLERARREAGLGSAPD